LSCREGPACTLMFDSTDSDQTRRESRGGRFGRLGAHLRLVLWCAAAPAVLLIVANILSRSAQESPLSGNLGGVPAVEPLTAVAALYAPYVYHATDPAGGRQDIISNIDFDGDLVGNNNWENFDRYRLKPTIYYAVLETPTHYLITYHLFHPRDWNHFTFWVNDTHENDGENLQVVVRKTDGRVVLLWTQAHYDSEVYANPESSIESAAIELSGNFLTVDDGGKPNAAGRHVAVFVESQGHGIYGALASNSQVVIDNEGNYSFEYGSGMLFRPARPGEDIVEPETLSGDCAYQLDSITLKLWPLLRGGELTGDGNLLDGSFPYRDHFIEINEVPRYYDANRFSGPFGSDRGISPFALDFFFDRGTLGALFFNPAKRYYESLKIGGEWSTEYIDYPFTHALARSGR
jgi:hypothetical protein